MTRALLRPAAALLAAAALLPACAARGWRVAFQEDNDVLSSFQGSDRDYSQGGILAATLPAAPPGSDLRAFTGRLPFLADKAPHHPALLLSQRMYTPDRIDLRRLQPNDRPWAGWLQVGAAVQAPDMDDDGERARDRVDTLGAEVGFVGPGTGAESAQRIVHRIIDAPTPGGWDHQLRFEPTVSLWWERRWRAARAELGDRWALDGLVETGARLGNAFTDARAGATLRVGWNLPRDFGAAAIDATGIREGAGEPPRGSVHLFGGGAATAVGRNMFLDGSLLRDSHRVDKRWSTVEAHYGLALTLGKLSASYTQVVKSPEFREKRRWHRRASLLLAWTEPF